MLQLPLLTHSLLVIFHRFLFFSSPGMMAKSHFRTFSFQRQEKKGRKGLFGLSTPEFDSRRLPPHVSRGGGWPVEAAEIPTAVLP